MAYTVKKATEEELEKFKQDHPHAPAPAGPWQVWEGDLLWGFYATEEDANEEKKNWERGDEVQELFEVWRDQTAIDHNMSNSEVDEIVGDYLRN